MSSSDSFTRRDPLVETIHGRRVEDPYRWLEDGGSEDVRSWTEARNRESLAFTDALPQKRWLYDRLQHLWRYDDESIPRPCLLSDRVLYRTKRAEQDKWVIRVKEGIEGEGRVVLDPNTWDEIESLAVFAPSPDGRYAVFGKTRGGDENPELRVLDLDTLEVFPDSFRGWKQGAVSWLHDNSGFFYSSRPREGEVPPGEHHYWHRVWFHRLGTTADADRLFFKDDEVKEHWHVVGVSEDGNWLVMMRGLFNKHALWLKDLRVDEEPVPLVTALDQEYRVDIVEERLFITTDWKAPNYRVMVTGVNEPGREHWREFIAESSETLSYVNPVGGKIYAVYQRNASTRIAVHDLEGTYLHDVDLPTIGSAGVFGYWRKPPTWLSFSSFAFPPTTYTYDARTNRSTLYKESPIDIDPGGIEVEQVWYPSKDGTRISMFLIHREGAPRDGSTPYLLTGYGGFNISRTPYFSTLNAVWVEAGGGVAMPNLRGGGEYGRAWHEAGMRERKQNVFDDFLAAAEWLESQGYSSRERLAISGGSNGGLLVSVAIAQRPELFRAVLCQVPLADMVRYQRFGLANIWAEEYGSADDPEMFPYLLAYSPYHNLRPGRSYPAVLVTGGENDARTDPAHARKLYAALRWAAEGGERPILLHVQQDSGHTGGVTIDTQADQTARHFAFLMHEIGIDVPSFPPDLTKRQARAARRQAK